MRRLLLPIVLLLSGCASSGYTIGCGHVTGNDLNYPGIVNHASANLEICRMSCVGNCKPIDQSILGDASKAYFAKLNIGNSITTSGPAVITVTQNK